MTVFESVMYYIYKYIRQEQLSNSKARGEDLLNDLVDNLSTN